MTFFSQWCSSSGSSPAAQIQVVTCSSKFQLVVLSATGSSLFASASMEQSRLSPRRFSCPSRSADGLETKSHWHRWLYGDDDVSFGLS
jgi:hypothetical protein